ncbi:MAG: ribosome silencing factor [Thermotogaceae bacterium]|nr:ribosome silencing factor [Thermotogaceae bacterium]
MDLVKEIFQTLLQKEAIEPVILDMTETPLMTDYFIVVTANSQIHMKALRDSVLSVLEKRSHPIIHYDKSLGYDWLIIDAGEIVVHVFTAKGREFYDLEGLWSDAKRV